MSTQIHFGRFDERSCKFGQPKSWQPYRITVDPNEVTCECCKGQDTLTLSATGLAALAELGYVRDGKVI